MKGPLKFLSVFALLLVTSCSEQKVEPQPLTQDLRTFANYYWDRFFSIHLTTSFDDALTFYLDGTGGEVTVDWGDGHLM